MRNLKINDKVVYVGDCIPWRYGDECVIVNVTPTSRWPYKVRFKDGRTLWCFHKSLKNKEVESPYPNLF